RLGGRLHEGAGILGIDVIDRHNRDRFLQTARSMDYRGTFIHGHADLIRDTARLLAPEGTLIFSTNRTKFRMDAGALNGLTAEDITEDTIPRDFERNRRIHSCWLIRRGESGSEKKAGPKNRIVS
ncbi:MAG TPA: hypothetical protein PKX40_08255, partial [Spirochaetota bacterium]|nr:hypothetical protein [Spirochaetota bacterium]